MEEAAIFGIRDEGALEKEALRLFRDQAEFVPPYREFLSHLGKDPATVTEAERIPFFPVRLFKTHKVLREDRSVERTFRSSGTSEEEERAHHHVSDLHLYDRSWHEGFRYRYGDPAQYRFLALLPSYSERGDASLVHMVEGLMKASGHPENGFFLHDHEALLRRIEELEERKLPTILIGVSFALLDFLEKHSPSLRHTIVMETGGMKGRRREMVREELHDRLKTGFGVDRIHSEYGMTELLSQAYAKADGIFHPPPWMKVMAREIEDPFSILPPGRSGALNVIDLANRNSCAFLALDDLGRVHEDGSFEVLGRMDGSDVRGCNLMWS